MAPNSSPFKAVVFDMDGLLLDSERPTRAAWRAAAAAFGVPLSEAEYLSVVGLNHIESAARMLGWFGGDAARLAAAGDHANAALLSGPPFEPKPGARRLLRTLAQARIPCAVASSTHRAEVERRLDRAGLLGHFAALCGGDEVVHGKPAPDLYRLALQRLGASAATSIAFEDSGHGVQAALAAGLATVAVPDLKAPSSEWLARCIAVLPSLEDACTRCPEWFGVLCAT
ncbi:MAG TPA: HAD family phosphatase [Burkholderiaceae bacterium]|jgi:beta-phosphoglucomutase-like phosphatase (HAD superfamily)